MSDTRELVIQRDVPVPMRDGVELRADVYYPASGRWPVLVQRTPYGRTRWIGSFVGLNPVELASRGYAVVVQDVRGRGESPGEHYPFDEANDGYDTIEWAATQPWSNGRVGGYGSSYMAASQMQEAVAAPPSLAVVCPVQAPDDYFEGRSYWGGAFEFGSMVSIALGAQAGGTLERLPAEDAARLLPLIGPALDKLTGSTPTFPLREWIGPGLPALRELTPWFFDWLDHPNDDAFWQKINVSSRHSSVTVPALHITGWYDSFCTGAIRNFVGLRSNAATDAARDGQYLIVGPWSHYSQAGLHSARVSGGYFGAAAALNLLGEQMNWFAEHLQPDAGQATERPRVRYFMMGDNQWRTATDWPPPQTRPLQMVLARDRRLVTEVEEAESVAHFDYDPRNPVPTEGGAHLIGAPRPPGPADQSAIEARPDVLVYTSDVLLADIAVVGWVRAHLHVMSSAPCTDFTAKLVDVHPDGTPMSVCDGIHRVLLEAGEPKTLTIELGTTAMNFQAGHRIRLDVSSSNFPRFDPNPNTGRSAFDEDAPVVAHQRIFHGGDRPSVLTLPVLDDRWPRA
jgi:putative CocE/NonD family hydrolase